MTERRVQGLLQDLVNHGHLTIETGGGRHATNRYRPVFEDADSCAPSLDQKRWAKSSNSVSSAETRNPEGHFGVSGRKTPKLAASKPRNQFHPNPYKEPCTPKVPTGTPCDDAHSAWRSFESVWRFDMGACVRKAIEAAGATLLYLPPYSPRLQSDRKGVLKTQGPVAQGRRANRRRAMGQDRPAAEGVLADRMRKLLRRRRI